MALVLKDSVLETCTSPGTGTVTLLGAVTGYQSFSTIGDGNTCYYTIADQSGASWEVGIGTYSSSAGTLARTTVLSSSSAGALTNFSSGVQNVFLTYPSSRAVNLSSGTLTSGRVTYATTGGALTDSANLTFNGTDLNLSGMTLGFGNGGNSSNIAIGINTLAGSNVNGSNIGIGQLALNVNTTGSSNIALGIAPLRFNLSGGNNIAIGYEASRNNVTGSDNIAIGNEALYTSVGHQRNIAIGSQALRLSNNSDTVVSNNLAIGWQSGSAITTGKNNVIIGPFSGYGLSADGTRYVDVRQSAGSIVLSDGYGFPFLFSTSVNAGNTTIYGKLQVTTGIFGGTFAEPGTGGVTTITPISHFYSVTTNGVPDAANLIAGQLALNTTDGKLFYKDTAGVVQVLANKGTSGGTFTSVNATSITDSGLTSGRVTYAGASGLLSDSANLTYGSTGLGANGVTLKYQTGLYNVDSTLSSYAVDNWVYLNGNAGGGLQLRGDGTGNQQINLQGGSSSYINFNTNALERMRITSAGNVGIGTSSPNYQLHVTTSMAVGASGFNQQLSFTNDTIQSLLLGTGYTALKLNPLGGNVGIGTSSPSVKLSVVGDAKLTGAGTYTVFTMEDATASGSSWALASGFPALGDFTIREAGVANWLIIKKTSGDAIFGGNLGLGVTPSVNTVSGSGYRQIEIGTTAGNMFFAGGNELFVSQNAIYNSGWKYAQSVQASQYRLNGGQHQFYTAPSGTAGNAITFTQAMTLDANGSLALGATAVASSNGGMTITCTSSGSSSAPLTLRNAGTANGSGVYLIYRGVTNTGAEHDYAYFNMVADDTTAKTSSMRFSTANGSSPVERMLIDSSGNVGIGTASTPAGSSAASRFLTVAGSTDGILQLTKTSATAGGGAIASAAGPGMLFFTHTGTVGSETYSERMRISSNGQVLVSTTGISGTVKITSTDAAGGYGANVSLNNTGTGGREYWVSSTSNGDGEVSGGKLKFYDATANATRMLIDSSGFVGIGQTNPICLLDIYGSGAYTYARFYRSDEAGYGGRVGTGNTLHSAGAVRSLGLDGFSQISFGIAGAQKAQINSSGNVIINASSTVGTGGKFQVTSDADTSIFKCTSNTTYAAIVANVEQPGPNLMAFQYGSGVSPTNVGSITTNGTITSYNVSSDYRLKENIVPMTGALAKVAQLKPVTYKWKSNGSDGQGFIAHELQAVVPDCVTGEKDAVDEDGKPKYQAMDTSHLVATLVSAIQEQQALIESLTTRLTALENK